MQTSFLMGSAVNENMITKNPVQSQAAIQTKKGYVFDKIIDQESFLEIVSQLINEFSVDISKEKDANKFIQKLMDDETAQTFISDFLPLFQLHNNSIDQTKQTLIPKFLPILNASEAPTDQLNQAYDLLALLSQKLYGSQQGVTGSTEGDLGPLSISTPDDEIMPLEEVVTLENTTQPKRDMQTQVSDSKNAQTVIKVQLDDLKSDNLKTIAPDQKNPDSFPGDDVMAAMQENDSNGLKWSESDKTNISEKITFLNFENTKNIKGMTKNKDGAFDSTDSKEKHGIKLNVVPEKEIVEKIESFSSEYRSSADGPDIENGFDSTTKPVMEKTSSIITETKTMPRPQQHNQTEIIQQIVEKAKISGNKSHNEIMIKLKPETLGNIRLNISTENQHVIIKVIADSSTVKEILENNLHHLKDGFVHQGLEIGSFDVLVGDGNEQSYKGQNFSGFQRNRRQSAGQRAFSWNDSEEDPILNRKDINSINSDDRIDYYA